MKGPRPDVDSGDPAVAAPPPAIASPPSGSALGGAQRRRALADADPRSRAAHRGVTARGADRAALRGARRARAHVAAPLLPRRRVVLPRADAGDRHPVLSRAPSARAARAEPDDGCGGGQPRPVPRLLRHECGHAVRSRVAVLVAPEVAAHLRQPRRRVRAPSTTARAPTQSFVRHLPNWYAQAHPDEDFAETFAVWLARPRDEWRERYQGWKAIEKLEYVDTLMERGAEEAPCRRRTGHGASDASKLRLDARPLLRRAKRSSGPRSPPTSTTPTCAAFSAASRRGRNRRPRSCEGTQGAIVTRVVRWTGQRKYMVDALARKLIRPLHEASPPRAGRRDALAARGGRVPVGARDEPPSHRALQEVGMKVLVLFDVHCPAARPRLHERRRCARRRRSRPRPTCSGACASSVTRSRRWPSTTRSSPLFDRIESLQARRRLQPRARRSSRTARTSRTSRRCSS